MALFSRISNLTRGLWIANTRPSSADPTEEAAFERELAATRPKPPPSKAPARQPVAPPQPAPEPVPPPELDGDGNVKRSL